MGRALLWSQSNDCDEIHSDHIRMMRHTSRRYRRLPDPCSAELTSGPVTWLSLRNQSAAQSIQSRERLNLVSERRTSRNRPTRLACPSRASGWLPISFADETNTVLPRAATGSAHRTSDV